MALASAGSCANHFPCFKQITMPAANHSFFWRLDALPDAQATVSSTEGNCYTCKFKRYCCFSNFLSDCLLQISIDLPLPSVGHNMFSAQLLSYTKFLESKNKHVNNVRHSLQNWAGDVSARCQVIEGPSYPLIVTYTSMMSQNCHEFRLSRNQYFVIK